MEIHTKIYPIWYAEIYVPDVKVFDLIVDSLSEHTGENYSFQFEINSQSFLEFMDQVEPLLFKGDPLEVLLSATKTIKRNGVDRLIFINGIHRK